MHQSDPTFHTLHAVRLRGRASTAAVTNSLGDAGADAAALLQAAVDAGHLTYKEGRAAGWSLTSEGRDAHARLVAADRQACGAIEVVRTGYEQFLGVNHDLITCCTSWQVKPDGSVNDHTDAGYDEVVIGSLGAIDERIQPVCGQLASALARFTVYGPALAHALARIRGGETQWFTSPAVDSYHTVWFELHEDLLQTLGLERAHEGQ